MEIEGRIIVALDPREGVSKTGNPWKVQEYVLETQEQYPRKMAFEVFGSDRVAQFASLLQVGNNVRVSFDIDAREWNGRWFNSIRAWKVETPQADQPAPVIPDAPAATPFPPAPEQGAAAGGESTDDLPF